MPMVLVSKVPTGSKCDCSTRAWAARWKTISGLTSSSTSARRSRSRMSPNRWSIRVSSPRSPNTEGEAGTSSEYPVTSAPRWFSHRVSQEPLKPVCPVTRTRFPL